VLAVLGLLRLAGDRRTARPVREPGRNAARVRCDRPFPQQNKLDTFDAPGEDD
jgi:hypothetical protein